MSWSLIVRIVLFLIQYGPEIIELIEKIIDAINGSSDPKMARLGDRVKGLTAKVRAKGSKEDVKSELRDLISCIKENRL